MCFVRLAMSFSNAARFVWWFYYSSDIGRVDIARDLLVAARDNQMQGEVVLPAPREVIPFAKPASIQTQAEVKKKKKKK